MHGAAERPADFDYEVRDQIRRKLHHYMRRHRIGVPTLARRIRESLPRKQEIPVKTLQRFLAGHRRTNDSYVALFDVFAGDIPDPDPIGSLGRAMADLLNSQPAEEYSGTFLAGLRSLTNPNIGLRPVSIISRTEDRFYRISERTETTTCRTRYEGVLVTAGKSLVFNLIETLTLGAKTYHLIDYDGMFEGHGTMLEPGLSPSDHAPNPRIEFATLTMRRE